MFNLISPSKIIYGHLGTLKSAKTGKIHFPYIFLFFILPTVLSSLLIFFNLYLDKDAVNLFVTVFSIFVGLLLNLLLLVFDIHQKTKISYQSQKEPQNSITPVQPPINLTKETRLESFWNLKNKSSNQSQQAELNQTAPVLIPTISSRKEAILELLNQVYSNISFSILISIFNIYFLLLYFIVDKLNQRILVQIISWFAYYLACIFALTLMMVLKRVHYLIGIEMR